MPKNPLGTSHVPDRDETSGRNAEQDLSALDARYNSHPDRMGVNRDNHDVHHGERVGHDAAPRNEDETPRQSFEKPLGTGTASEYSEACRQDRTNRRAAITDEAAHDGKGPIVVPPFNPRD
jgi:hypothetical protein